MSEAARAAKLLRKNGEPIVFEYTTGGAYNPATGGIGGATTNTINAYGYPAQYKRHERNSDTILDGDIRLVSELVAVKPEAGWFVTIDSKKYRVMDCQAIRKAGADVIYIIQVRA